MNYERLSKTTAKMNMICIVVRLLATFQTGALVVINYSKDSTQNEIY